MDEAGEGARAAVRRVQVRAVQAHPQILAIPDVDEGVVDARRLAVVPEVLVLIDLDHAGAVQLRHLVAAALRLVP